jgi:hypothetical protein
VLIVTFAALCAPVQRVAAVSYSPLVHHEPGEETIAGPGSTVYLFHSGVGCAGRTLLAGEVLTVVRVLGTCESAEVGKVRAIALVGENYLKAEVVSGSVKPNDIARDGSVACLVLSARPCERK